MLLFVLVFWIQIDPLHNICRLIVKKKYIYIYYTSFLFNMPKPFNRSVDEGHVTFMLKFNFEELCCRRISWRILWSMFNMSRCCSLAKESRIRIHLERCSANKKKFNFIPAEASVLCLSVRKHTPGWVFFLLIFFKKKISPLLFVFESASSPSVRSCSIKVDISN